MISYMILYILLAKVVGMGYGWAAVFMLVLFAIELLIAAIVS